MIWRGAFFGALLVSSASADDTLIVPAESLFAPGTVLCSNYRERTRSCRTITTVTALQDGVRYTQSRRFVAMPDENLLLETEGTARVEGNKVCAIGPTADPRISPDHHPYAAVLIAVYERRRDKKIRRGVCHEYRRCGTGWEVYITYDDEPEPRLVSYTTVFGPQDEGRLGLSLRYREFGVSERAVSECSPYG